jgi:hypothetical protein
MRAVIFVAAFALFTFFYVKYLERHATFHPMREINIDPADYSMDYSDVYFYSQDGVRLNGWFFPKENGPVLLYCHGNAGNIGHRLEIIDMFLKSGTGVFIFDYRGYGRSSGTPGERGIYADAAAAYDYLINEKGYEEQSIIVYGESLGSAPCLETALRRSPKAVILEGAFTSARDMAKKVFPAVPPALISGSKFNNAEKIKRIECPVLVIHSRDDEIVPYRHSEVLFDNIPGKKRRITISGGHNEAMLMNKEKLISGIKDFISSL